MNDNKINDMLLATMNNPVAKPHDFLNNDVTAANTQLKDKDFYKSKSTIKDAFTNAEGKFDDSSFDIAYNAALQNYNLISNQELLNRLTEVKYDPNDWTRPRDAKVFNPTVKFSTDLNPFKNLYSREGINTITESKWSLRELAQKGRVHDVETDTWFDSVNKQSIFNKFFGDTLVYAQWDEDGVHEDPLSGQTVKHSKGDWKYDKEGSLYLEKLGNREIYGKQVVSTSDILTTDGSVWNKFDFFDSDGREKSKTKVVTKMLAEVAPLLIPVVNTVYGGTRAALGLISVMPTFYKSLESLLLGDNKSIMTDPVTKAEGWLSKFNTKSTSDEAAEGFWNFEQMTQMVTDIFSQIYEQRAMASLSKVLVRPDKALMQRESELKLITGLKAKHLAESKGIDITAAISEVLQNTPDIKRMYEQQSKLSKALSLGYMALTSTSDVYGEALESGYDRRTAGFASLLTASGQYGIMMNNQLGDWFLDKTTGYNIEVNKAAMRRALKPYMGEISESFKEGTVAAQKSKLASVVSKVKKSFSSLLTEMPELGEQMWKNAVIEGIEEVTEQVVEDTSKAVVDLFNYFGWTKGKGSFDTIERYTSGEAFNEYLANFVGGVLGGGLFELERLKISPFMNQTFRGKQITPETKKHIYEYVANGHAQELIKEVKKLSKDLSNEYVSIIEENGQYKAASEGDSHADIVSKKTIELIETLDKVFHKEGVHLTDNEIINKAIRTQVLISEFDKNLAEGRHVGLEGLVIEDFRTNALKIVDIANTLTELEKDPDANEGTIKQLKEDLKPLRAKRDAILNGEYGMKYFDQISIMLDPNLKELFGSLDRETFIKAKYKQSYDVLPADGPGLTKKVADDEWEEFLDSTDLMAKLEFITNAYKELENVLNPAIAEYIDSGYIDVIQNVFKSVIDIEKTLDLYNTETDITKKKEIINNFININNKLEQSGHHKVIPWDVINYDAFTSLFNENLFKRLNDDGSLSEFTDAELKTKDASGVTLQERIQSTFNNFAKIFPTSMLDVEFLIESFNAQVDHDNRKILLDNENILNTNPTDPETLKTVEENKKRLINFKLDTYDNMPIITKKKQEIDSNIAKIISDVEFEKPKGLFDSYLKLQSLESLYNETFDEKLENLGLPKNINDFTDEHYETLISNLKQTGLWSNAKSYFTGEDAVETFKEVDNQIYNANKLEEILKYLQDTVNANYNVLNDDSLKDADAKIKEEQEAYENFKLENKPEFLQTKNVAFNYLLEAIQQEGQNDGELYRSLKKMFLNEVNPYFDSLLTDFKGVSEQLRMKAIYNQTALDDDINFIKTGIFFHDSSKPNDWVDEYFEGDILDLSTATMKDLFDTGIIEDDSILKELILNQYKEDDLLIEIYDTITKFHLNQSKLKSSGKLINDFLAYEAKKQPLKSNPIYDFIRNFSLTLNTNPKNPVNKIFDILQFEETMFMASNGASNYTSDNIREKDLKQAINTIDMILGVINSMSTTEYYDDSINGFLAMRQRFAKESGIQDDVLNLKTLSSDQANLMSKDLLRIRNRLNFIMNLATENSIKTTAEDEIIRDNQTHSNLSILEHISKNPKLNQYIPDSVKELLKSNTNPEKKLLEIEDAIYKYNVGNESKFFEDILKYEFKSEDGQIVDSNNRNVITKDTKREEITPFTKVIYLASILSSSSKDFQLMYVDTLERLNKAPFYMQELAARIVYASVVNPELFALIYKYKANSDNDLLEFITYLLGGAGTGKTSAILPIVVDLLRQTNESSKLWIIAPNIDQSNKFNSDLINAIGKEKLSINNFDKKGFFSLFGDKVLELWNKIDSDTNNFENIIDNDEVNKLYEFIKVEGKNATSKIQFNLPDSWATGIDFSTLPNLVAIDEITHFSKAEIILLNAISKMSLSKGHFMKIIGAGDNNQTGKRLKYGSQFVGYNINGSNSVFTPTLSVSIRATTDQKRLNSSLLLNLNTKAQELIQKYTKLGYEKAQIVEKANIEFLQNYLNNNQQNIGLKYYNKDGKFRGDYIQTNANNISVLKTIKEELDSLRGTENEKSFNVLSKNGNLNENTKIALEAAGFAEDQYNIFTLDNIQGSESDFFLYDIDLIPNLDVYSDFMQDFYTLTTRSKDGTIILDTNNRLDTMSLKNAAESDYFVTYDPMTDEVVKSLKEARIAKIKEMLGDYTKSSYSDFKWKQSEVKKQVKKEQKPKRRKEITGTSGIDNEFNSITDEIYKDLLRQYRESERKFKFSPEDFEPMIHSTYNNLNVRKVQNTNNAYNFTLEAVNSTPTDLNLRNFNNKLNYPLIVNHWASVKTDLFYNKPKSINLSNSNIEYFKNIFNLNGKTSGTIDNIEYLITAVRYDKNANDPQFMSQYDSDKTLKNGDLMLNISAKLNYEGDVHYITLATFATQKSITDTIKNIVQTDANGKDVKEIVDKKLHLLTKVNNLYSNIDSINFEDLGLDIIDLVSLDGKEDIDIITSTQLTRAEGEDVKYSLIDLKYKLPGLKFSNIRLYPQDFEMFKSLYSKYTFGHPIPDDILKEMHQKFRNKPYIVVSFNNDLDGSPNGTINSARLLPLLSESRSVAKMKQEINSWYDALTHDMNKHYSSLKEGDETPYAIPTLYDAGLQSIIGRPQIIDILMRWESIKDSSGKTLLDLLTTEIGTGEDVPVRPLDVMDRLRKQTIDEESITTQNLLMIINDIQDVMSKESDKDKAKAEIVNRIKFVSGWNFNFLYLFAYDSILKGEKFRKQTRISDNQSQEIKKIIDSLVDSIKDMNIYYNIPIITTGDGLEINPIISNGNGKGFVRELYHNKYYIGITPEAPKALVNMEKFLELSNFKITKEVEPSEKEVEGGIEEENLNYLYFSELSENGIVNLSNDTSNVFKVDLKTGEITNQVDNLILDGWLIKQNSEGQQVLIKLNKEPEFPSGNFLDSSFTVTNADGTNEIIQPLKPFNTLLDISNSVDDLDKAIIDEFLEILKNEEIFDSKSSEDFQHDIAEVFTRIIGKSTLSTKSLSSAVMVKSFKDKYFPEMSKNTMKLVKSEIFDKIVDELNRCK